MVKQLFMILMILLAAFVSSCSQNSTAPEDNFSILGGELDDSEFLLISDDDPTELASEAAFRIDGHGSMFFWVLDLTDEQKEQIRTITGSYRGEFRELHQQWRNGDVSFEDIKAQRDSLHAVIQTEILTVLTPEQIAILEDIQNQIDNGQFPTQIIEKRVEFLADTLGLDATQQQQITDIMVQYGAELLAARANSDNRREFRETARGIFQAMDEAIAAVLTEDQLAIYRELKANHSGRNRGKGWRGQHRPGGPRG